MRKVLWSCIAALLWLCSDGAYAACYATGTCTDTPSGCIPTPTSLRPTSTAVVDTGWSTGEKCGTEGWGPWRWACGHRLGIAVCGAGGGGGGGGGGTCDCGPWVSDFCEYSTSADELNAKARAIFGDAPGAEPPARNRRPARPTLLPAVKMPSAAAHAHAAAGLTAVTAFYRALQTVTLEASAMVTRNDTGVNGRGHVSFAGDHGGRYRLRITTDPQLELAPDLKTSFDGANSHLFLERSKILSLHRGSEVDAAGSSAIPNPLFLPLLAVSPESDACPACSLTLREAASADWSQRLAGSKAVWMKNGGARLFLTGRTLGGRESYFVLEFDAAKRLVRLEERLASGNPRLVITFETYRSVPDVTGEFPFHLSVAGYDHGEELGTTGYHVQSLRANEAVQEVPAYALERNRADVVWDATEEKYLKHFQVWPPDEDD